MFARYENKHYTAIDVQEDMIEMATRSMALNNIQDTIKMLHLNVKDLMTTYSKNSFDIVTCNPPYMKGKAGLVNENESKMIARHEITCSLEDIIQNAAYVLKDKGKLYMIHRPHRLVDILSLMRQHKIEPKRMRMIHPKEAKAPTMVLIEGVKYAKAELIVEAPLYIYNTNGKYTDEVYDIYGMEKEDQ